MCRIHLFLCLAITIAVRISADDGSTPASTTSTSSTAKPEPSASPSDKSLKIPLAPVASTAPKVIRIYIDTLADNYLAIEKSLWTKIETQQLLVDRGQLLDEIYREHKRILEADFGQHSNIWSLGLQRHAKLFNDILAINTNAQNIKEYIFAKENDKVLELAQNAHEQMAKSATEFNQLISDKSFWDNIVYNVS